MHISKIPIDVGGIDYEIKNFTMCIIEHHFHRKINQSNAAVRGANSTTTRLQLRSITIAEMLLPSLLFLNRSFFKNGPFPASFSLFSSFQYS